jgi:hypothetical protein
MRKSKKLVRAVALAMVMAGVFGMRGIKADDGGPGGPSRSSCAFVMGISFHMPDAVAAAFLSMWNAVLGCNF